MFAGVAAWIRKDSPIKLLSTSQISTISDFQAIEMRTNTLHKIILFYRSPNQKKKGIQETIEYFESVENDSIIVGDLNVPGRDWNVPYHSGKGIGKSQLKENVINVLLCQGTKTQHVHFPTNKIMITY